MVNTEGSSQGESGTTPPLASDSRDAAAEQRDREAERADQEAHRRDRAAEERDSAAGRRDQVGQEWEHAAEQSPDWPGGRLETEALQRSASARRHAAADRSYSSQDRGAGADDRGRAELDRHAALADRGASAREWRKASVDGLTGVHLRGSGFLALEREMARARRLEAPLMVAFVDVDGLKTINDSRGHAAGDRVLIDVAVALRSKLRSYDLIIRYGGDEFVCAVSGLTMADVKKRFELVSGELGQTGAHPSVTVGFAEFRPDDSLEDLVGRADNALYQARREKKPPS